MRGASRSSRTSGAGCGGRSGLQRGLILARTNIPMRTVKPCGPGIPVLMPSLRRRFAGDGGKNAGPRGELGAAVPTIAQGRPVVRLVPVVTAACVFCCRRAMGAACTRPSLRPLSRRGRLIGIARARNAPRDREFMPQRGFEGRPSMRRRSPLSLPPA